jgi:hypothetical protein
VPSNTAASDNVERSIVIRCEASQGVVL